MDYIHSLSSHIDFVGQKRSERLYQVIIVLFGAAGLVAGYVTQAFSITVYAVIAGFVVSCLLILPPWPFWRQHPLEWQKPVAVEGSDSRDNGGGEQSTSSGGGGGAKTRKPRRA